MNSLKLVALLGVIVGSAAGYEFAEPLEAQELSVSSQIIDAIEEIKLQMPCGFPGLGIPPLDPLRDQHRSVNLTNENISLNGTADNIRLDGLHNFDIVDFRVSLLLRKVNFNFVWNNVHLKTLYDLLFKSNENTLGLQLHRKGLANIALKGLKIWGQSKYSISVISNHLKLKEFKVFVSIDKVVSNIGGLMRNPMMNRLMNDIVEEWIMLAINDNTQYIGEVSNKYVVPIINDAIGDKSLTELYAAIGARRGGPNVPKEPCIPQEDF